MVFYDLTMQLSSREASCETFLVLICCIYVKPVYFIITPMQLCLIIMIDSGFDSSLFCRLIKHILKHIMLAHQLW